MDEPDLRCFWMDLTEVPKGCSPRVFVALCDGAAISGDPIDCNCTELVRRIEDLQAEVGRLRQRCAWAEGAQARHDASRRSVLTRYRSALRDLRRRAPLRGHGLPTPAAYDARRDRE